MSDEVIIVQPVVPNIVVEPVIPEVTIASQGAQGERGPQGPSTIAVGTTTTTAAGSNASVTNVGTSEDLILDFDIPRGNTGAQGEQGIPGNAATINVGTTTTGAAGTSAEVNNSGTTSAAVFNFTIPQGIQGATGATGATGAKGDKGDTGDAATIAVGTTTTGAAGTPASVVNSGTTSAAIFDFTIPQGIKGDTGATGATGATGSSGVVAVTAPITNSGTSTSANIGIDTANFALLDTANTFTTSPQQINTASSATVGLIIKRVVSQTANLQQWQNENGTVLSRVASNGAFRVGGVDLTGSGLGISLDLLGASTIGMIVRGAASQTANLFETQDSAGTSLVRISASGVLITAAGKGVMSQYYTGLSSGAGAYIEMGSSTMTLATRVATNTIRVVGAASQTANLTEWQDSAGTVLALVSQVGAIRVSSSIGYVGGGGSQLVFQSGANPAQFIPTTAATIGLVVKGFASQTADLQQWQDSTGAILLRVYSSGAISRPSGGVLILNEAAGDVVLRVRGFASQTANLQEWQNSTGSIIARMDVNGSLRLVSIGSLNAGNAILSPGGDTNGFLIGTVNAGNKGLVIKGVASQTANLQEWQNSAGTVLSYVTSSGSLRAPFLSDTAGTGAFIQMNAASSVTINARSATNVGLVVFAATSQTADLQQWQNSSGTALSKIDSAGNFTKGDGDQLVLAGQVFG